MKMPNPNPNPNLNLNPNSNSNPKPKPNPNPKVDVILDIAHNEDAMKALVMKVKKLYPYRIIRVVLGMSADKDLQKCLSPVLELMEGDASRIHCVSVSVRVWVSLSHFFSLFLAF
jgi:folylpolyglutamate synthase/dihydropteroate synthase